MTENATAAPRTPHWILAAAAVPLAVWLVAALPRLVYPFDVEMLEGAGVDHAHRIAAGLPLYAEPAWEFTAMLYTPLYFALGALVGKVVGVGHETLRAISFAATLASLVFLWLLARGRVRDPRAALLAPALYLASYRAVGTWFELARPDSLALALGLGGLVLLARAERPGRGVLAGLAFSLAFFAKQSMGPLAGVALLGGLVRAPRAGGAALVAFLGATSLGIVALDLWSGDWFAWYCFELPQRHDLEAGMWTAFWTRCLLVPFGGAALLAGAAFFAPRRAPRERLFEGAALLGALSTALMGMLHVGGWNNVLMPMAALLAWLGALGFDELRARGGRLVRRTAAGLLCAQLALALFDPATAAWFDPRDAAPDAQDRLAGEALLAELRTHRGPLLAPYHGGLAVALGKPMHAHHVAMGDVMRADPRQAVRLERELLERLRGRQYGAVLLDAPLWRSVLPKHYIDLGSPFAGLPGFTMRTGVRIRPEHLWVPRVGPAKAAEGGR